jgi:ABC-type spermidine/putrescine transport system permease subunit I
LTIKESLKPLALLTPAIALEALLFFVPVSLLAIVSLTSKDSFFFTPVWTLSNFADIFSPAYLFDFEITFGLIISAAFLDLMLGFPFAYIMTRRIKKYQDVFRAIMLVPLFGELYIAYGFYYLFLPGGPLSFLFASGVEMFRVLYSMPAAVIALAIYTFPFSVYNIGISLQGIDRSIEESARCLGAGSMRTFVNVTLPMCLPGIVGAWLVSIGWGLGAFAIPTLMGGAVVAERMLSVEVYSIALLRMDLGMASAIGVILAVIAVIIFYISLKASRGALI